VTSNSHGTPRFIDTNILLRYFTGDDPRKAAACLALLQRIEDGQETAITSSLVVFETAFSLYSSYHLTRERIRDLLAPVLGLRGLRVPDRQTFLDALDLYAHHSVSFADAFNTVYARAHGVGEIYSYDRDFDRIPGMRRLEP